ncbi:MAG: RnfABCDGE type electron transport complex subunit D [Candidatus Omnitrophica bacterium]|nr:RnfABCDGE type electron transport complex subunit D [Candidatus Omnitrophota bacterium]
MSEKSNSVDLAITSSPHIRSKETTAKIMWSVTVCLIPSGLVSVYAFGISVFWIILTSIICAMASEWLFNCYLQKKPNSLMDGSAVLTGLLLAYNLPPGAPLWMAGLGSFVAIVFAKVVFGGLGFNIFNPALIGRVFLMASFPVLMTRWPALSNIDAITAPTPLAVFKDGFSRSNVLNPIEIINYSYQDLFLGLRGGCIGEASVLALLIGAMYLMFKKYISWKLPLSFVATVGIFTWIFGGSSLLRGDFLLHILSGGLILGAFYMATDYVTGPVTIQGQIIFGIGCGIITSIIRLWGGYPEGVSYSILLMNMVTPLIDRFVKPKRFGDK